MVLGTGSCPKGWGQSKQTTSVMSSRDLGLHGLYPTQGQSTLVDHPERAWAAVPSHDQHQGSCFGYPSFLSWSNTAITFKSTRLVSDHTFIIAFATPKKCTSHIVGRRKQSYAPGHLTCPLQNWNMDQVSDSKVPVQRCQLL